MKQKENYIFTIPVHDISYKYHTIYYSPLTKQVSSEPIDAPENISMPHSLTSIKDLRKMSILPNHRCNFNCAYCYAAEGRNTDELTERIADRALTFFIDKERTIRPLSVAILGGGEPMLSWRVSEHCIRKARQLAKEQGIHLEITVVTNGSIINEKIIHTFIDNNVIVNASFDLIKDKNLRSRFDEVKANIQTLCKRGVYVTINSTITPSNVGCMKQMIENAKVWFPEVEFMIFEPVIAKNLFANIQSLREFYDAYTTIFYVAKDYAANIGIDLTCRIHKSLDNSHDRGCDGRFNLCPNGDITICYCTASKTDPNFENRLFGKVDESSVYISESDFKKLCNENVYSFAKCDDCFARFNCAGGCMLPNDRYDEDYQAEVCRFNKEFIRRELLRRVEK